MFPGYPNPTHYTANFSRREMDCRCGCTAPAGVVSALYTLCCQLEHLRDEVGTPLTVLSGYRCPSHNEAVGGAAMSQHQYGIAADVASRTKSPAQVRRAAGKVPRFAAGGIGIYKSWVHVDLRTNGPARWEG